MTMRATWLRLHERAPFTVRELPDTIFHVSGGKLNTIGHLLELHRGIDPATNEHEDDETFRTRLIAELLAQISGTLALARKNPHSSSLAGNAIRKDVEIYARITGFERHSRGAKTLTDAGYLNLLKTYVEAVTNGLQAINRVTL